MPMLLVYGPQFEQQGFRQCSFYRERGKKKKIEALVDAEQKGEALLVTLWLLCLLSWRVL